MKYNFNEVVINLINNTGYSVASSRYAKNKTVYTATSVAYGWAGVVMWFT